MKTTKYIKAIALTSVLAMTATSCSDFLEEYSQDLAKVESWSDLDELLLGDGYLPHAMRGSNTGNLDILHFMADEMTPVYSYDATYSMGYGDYTESMFPFYTWMADTGLDDTRKYVGGDAEYWNDLYKRINICNIVLELIDEQPETRIGDADEKERVKGEAFFLRGAYYFLLANLYGKPYDPATADADLGVPVKLTGVVEDVEFQRVPLSAVYTQILSDLSDAERFLDGKPRKSVYRVNTVAVNLLQSRVYLYMQNWEKAAEYAEKVLKAQPSLLDLHAKAVGEDCLYKASPETIFSMGGYAIASAFADVESTFGGFYPAGYTVSDDMLSLYASNDLRRDRYIGVTELLGDSNAFMKVSGYSNKRNSYSEVSSTFLLRTPEAYLTYAEAMAFAGNEGAARTKLEDFLKTRMSEPVEVSESGNDLIDLIRNERAREFLLEGHRWFDLRRYTVCQPYPWSKTITHDYLFFTSSSWPYSIDYVERYVLEKNDAAYTLPIPRAIRNFQASIGNNVRPDRRPSKYTIEEDDDYDDDDWW